MEVLLYAIEMISIVYSFIKAVGVKIFDLALAKNLKFSTPLVESSKRLTCLFKINGRVYNQGRIQEFGFGAFPILPCLATPFHTD